MAAAAAGQAGFLAEDFGEHFIEVHALGHGDVVRAMGGGDDVLGIQVRADADRTGLLAVG
ncbi:hypothetical protein D3C87_1905330 [compost metagenome]